MAGSNKVVAGCHKAVVLFCFSLIDKVVTGLWQGCHKAVVFFCFPLIDQVVTGCPNLVFRVQPIQLTCLNSLYMYM